MDYFRIRSWHIRKETTPVWKSYCGMVARHDSEVSNELPMGEKSCESCLRLARRKGD